ncbi:hypothetical protein L4G92_05910 [Neisseria sp. ZJ106]|uniref:Uncharacterized protein n=1 Tax=Neisseria lisongii TaxID=2912188 RepID=A0ABY7RKA2_9NEIS|nr:hypothetical protein [Neisseria lisongii]MCF7521581.1 hypothetical protein [Neisseria lisongii]WCL71817.1 hypothetical protein PJU73_01420 [Neisseria lisongii]
MGAVFSGIAQPYKIVCCTETAASLFSDGLSAGIFPVKQAGAAQKTSVLAARRISAKFIVELPQGNSKTASRRQYE